MGSNDDDCYGRSAPGLLDLAHPVLAGQSDQARLAIIKHCSDDHCLELHFPNLRHLHAFHGSGFYLQHDHLITAGTNIQQLLQY